MVAATSLDRFLAACSAETTRRAEAMISNEISTGGRVSEGAAAFAAQIDHAVANPIAREPTTVAVADHVASLEPGGVRGLAADAVAEIPWIASHRMTDGGTEAALAPLNEVRDFGDLTVGLLLLGPGCAYPVHNHPPQELYLPISDDGMWRFGGSDEFVSLPVDYLPYNNPHDVHAIMAGVLPTLGLYVLWP